MHIRRKLQHNASYILTVRTEHLQASERVLPCSHRILANRPERRDDASSACQPLKFARARTRSTRTTKESPVAIKPAQHGRRPIRNDDGVVSDADCPSHLKEQLHRIAVLHADLEGWFLRDGPYFWRRVANVLDNPDARAVALQRIRSTPLARPTPREKERAYARGDE
jgi:hypothetical protein